VVGFKTPHGPRGGENLPERLRSLYAGQQSRPVSNLAVPAIYRAGERSPKQKDAEVSQPAVVPAHLDYMRHVAGADENLGRLLKALDELGLAENTMVVYTSDNGYYLGEHGLGDKRSLYEESLRIPLVVRYPKLFLQRKVLDEMVLNIDLAPTFLELAGVSVPPEMQGRSWVPLLTGKSADWRSSFLAEYFRENNFPTTPSIVGVRTASAKLINYPNHPEWRELFDLGKDSYETKNLAQAAAGEDLRRQMQAEFEAQVKATGYLVPEYADKPGSPREAPRKKPGKAKKK
jgi:arylsulfatase A-like enzyme